MRCIRLTCAITGLSILAATLSCLASPVAGARVCGRLDLSSPCVSSSDLRARLNVGSGADDGRLRLRDGGGATAVELHGSTGNVTNLFADDLALSNGLVKAWAQINKDGTVAACWRCNTDPLETNKFGTGDYEVDFTPLSTDIRGRPRIATISGVSPPVAVVRVINRNVNGNGQPEPDDSSVHVVTANPATGAKLDAPFVILIF